MTRGNHWQTLPWLNWRHPIGRQAAALARSPLGRFTALSTPDTNAQSDQPLAAYLVGYPIPPIEELRAAFALEATPPFRFSPAIGEPANLPFEPTTTQDVNVAAIAPPSPPNGPPAAHNADLPDLPPPLPAVQRQPLGKSVPLGSQVAAIAEAISGDGTPLPGINQHKIPSNDRPVLPDGNLLLPDATEQPLRDRHNPASNLSPSEVLSPPAHSPGTETAADRDRPDRPSSETPAAGSPPEPPTSNPHSAITHPSESADPLANSPALLDSDEAGVIQPRLAQSPIPPPAIAEPRSFHNAPDADTTTVGNQAPSQAWTGDSRPTGSPPDQADTLEPLNPEHHISTDATEGADAADTAGLIDLAALPPPRPTLETADSKSNTANDAAPTAPAAPESPTSENPPDLEARSQPPLPSIGETAKPPPSPPSSPGEPIQPHPSADADMMQSLPEAAIANSEAADQAAIAPTDPYQAPGSPPPPESSDLTAPPIGEDSPSDLPRNLPPDGTPTPPVGPTTAPPTQLPGIEDSPISLPKNQSTTAPKIPLLPNIQRYVAQTDRLLAGRALRSPLAELSDYLVPSTPQLTPPHPPVPSLPKSPGPEQSSEEILALPPSTPSTQGLTVPTTQPPQQLSHLPTLPVQMRTLESPTASAWESQFDLEPNFPELESTDFSLDDLEPDGLTTEADPADDESSEPAAASKSEAAADSEAVTLTVNVGGAEADSELLDHLAEWVYRELRSHLCLRRETQFGQSVALSPWYPQHPGLATQTVRSEQNLPSLPLPPTLHQLTTVVRQQVESRLRQDWERFPEYQHALRF
ncbi:MAG: hypothetical protein AAF773_07890 [Cyanobacteria bacterium P01_D01_bin.115]